MSIRYLVVGCHPRVPDRLARIALLGEGTSEATAEEVALAYARDSGWRKVRLLEGEVLSRTAFHVTGIRLVRRTPVVN